MLNYLRKGQQSSNISAFEDKFSAIKVVLLCYKKNIKRYFLCGEKLPFYAVWFFIQIKDYFTCIHVYDIYWTL